jgi:hypothetical protein
MWSMSESENKENLSGQAASAASSELGRAFPSKVFTDQALAPLTDTQQALGERKVDDDAACLAKQGQTPAEKLVVWEAIDALPRNTFVLLSVLSIFPDDEKLVQASLTQLLELSVQIGANQAGAYNAAVPEEQVSRAPTTPSTAALGLLRARPCIIALVETLFESWSGKNERIPRLLCGFIFDLSTVDAGREALAARSRLLELLCEAVTTASAVLRHPLPATSDPSTRNDDQLYSLYYALGALGNIAVAGALTQMVLQRQIDQFYLCVRDRVAELSGVFEESQREVHYASSLVHLVLIVKILREALRLLLNLMYHAGAQAVPRHVQSGLIDALEQIRSWHVGDTSIMSLGLESTASLEDATVSKASMPPVLWQAAARMMPLVSRLHRLVVELQGQTIITEAVDAAIDTTAREPSTTPVSGVDQEESAPGVWGAPILFITIFLGAAVHVGAHVLRDR